MKITGQAKELRIYIGESDQHKGRPLYQAIVAMARELGLAGATVARGIEGFGANSRIHTANILRLSQDLPVAVVIVDSAEYIGRLLPHLNEMVGEGLITIHDVEIIKYTHGSQTGGDGGAPEPDPTSPQATRPGGPSRG